MDDFCAVAILRRAALYSTYVVFVVALGRRICKRTSNMVKQKQDNYRNRDRTV